MRGAEYVVIYIIVGFIGFLQSVDQRIVINISADSHVQELGLKQYGSYAKIKS